MRSSLGIGTMVTPVASTPRLTFQIRRPNQDPVEQRLQSIRIVIGRESGDIVLGDPEASAAHAEIDCSGGVVVVRDLGSANGTWRGEQRLPQFALFEGQSFRCGQSDLTLLQVEGLALPVSGRTHLAQRPATSESGAPPAGRGSSGTMLDGSPPPPSSSPTLPGQTGHAGSSSTLQGPPRPRSAPPASSSTLVGFPSAPSEPHAPTPSTTGPSTEIPAAAPSPPDISHPVSPDGQVRAGVSTPSAAASYRPPVSNAVIKDPGVLGTGPSPAVAPRASRRGWLRWLAGGLGVVVFIGAVAFGVRAWLVARRLAFADTIARSMPEKSLGVIALASPAFFLDATRDDVAASVRDDVKANLGFDPWDREAYDARGIDLSAPVGAALLGVSRQGEPTFAASVGLDDPERFEAALRDELIPKLGPEATWQAMDFDGTDGAWIDGPTPVAILVRDDRARLVFGPSADDVEQWARSLAETRTETSLVERPGWRGLVPPDGEIELLVYADGGNIRDEVRGGMEAVVARMALSDMDGLVALLSHDEARISTTFETIWRENSANIELLGEAERTAEALDRVSGPVLAALDVALGSETLERGLSGLDAIPGTGLAEVGEAVSGTTGLDLRSDLVENLSGEVGLALLELPPPAESPKGTALVAWVGVRDEARARRAAQQAYDRLYDELGLTLREVEGVSVYQLEEPTPLRAFIVGDHAWVVLGEVDVEAIVKGDAQTSFLREDLHPAVARAIRAGGQTAGFVDLPPVFGWLTGFMDDDAEAWRAHNAPLLEPLEVLTWRSSFEGRASVTRVDLHATLEDPLPELLGRWVGRSSEAYTERLAAATREARCGRLRDHVTQLAVAKVGSADQAPWVEELRTKVLDRCRAPDFDEARIDCYLAAADLDALKACDEGEPPSEMKPPEPVAYVDDIWPNRTDPGRGRPDPEVNYAVDVELGLGEEPSTRGPDDALVTIVEFADFECPYSKQVAATLDEVLAEHGSYTRLVFRHNPLEMHPHARLAAKAALAAGRQGKFWEMHDELFAHQQALSEADVKDHAAKLGLDLVQFERDLDGFEVERALGRDEAAAERFGAQVTPVFFVNGRYLAGTQSAAAIGALVEEEKKRAERFVERRGNTRARLYEDMIGHFAPEVGAPPEAPVDDENADADRALLELDGLPSKGAGPFAQIQLVECGDFDCPFCARANPTIERILEEYAGQVTFYFAHNPLEFHAGAEPAARAAVAAQNQGEFWAMYERLFDDRKARSLEDFVRFAEDIGLDVERFERDFEAAETAKAVEVQRERCREHDARGTPTFFVNGRTISGAQPFESFSAVIEDELRTSI